MNGMNDCGSCDLWALDAMNNSRLGIIWLNLGCELEALDVMNNLVSGMTWMTLSHELRALDAMWLLLKKCYFKACN